MAAGDLIDRDGQIEWNGTLLGSGTVYRWMTLTGLEDLPGVDIANVARPSRHGSWPGQILAQDRTLTWQCRISVHQPRDFGAAVTALRKATAVAADDIDQPLVIRVKGGETRLLFARVANRALTNDKDNGIGRGQATIQWRAADPRWYSVAAHTVNIGQPAPGSGLIYPLDYPLDYGTGGETGSRVIVNAGDTATSPLVTFTGPCTTPQLIDVATARSLELNLVLAAGETVVIDTSDGSILLEGSDRSSALTARAVPPEFYTLQPGGTELAFRAAAGSGTCSVTWRDAYL